jgi:hypothetical protein
MTRYLETPGFDTFTLRGTWRDLENHLFKGRPVIAAMGKETPRRFTLWWSPVLAGRGLGK